MTKRPSKILDYYVLVYSPDHERAIGNGYVPEHILVAEKTLNRPLSPDEEVIHINGNAQDNRPSNLEIISSHADYRSQSLDADSDIQRRGSNRTFIPFVIKNRVGAIYGARLLKIMAYIYLMFVVSKL